MDHARAQYDDPLFAWQPPCKPAAPAVPIVCSEPAGSRPPAPDLPAEFALIWAVLEHHRGAEHAITAPNIADSAGLWPDMAPANRGTRVRKILEITQDCWPWPICGDTSGYYLAATAEELNHYMANLRSRAICTLRRYGTVRKLAKRAGFYHLGRGRFADPATGEGVMPIARAHVSQ
jgi:hypothetical protein